MAKAPDAVAASKLRRTHRICEECGEKPVINTSLLRSTDIFRSDKTVVLRLLKTLNTAGTLRAIRPISPTRWVPASFYYYDNSSVW
jgi:hypothetical protein